MIRSFLSVAVFTATITLASFGQNIFGRNDIIHWAQVVQANGPHRAQVAWAKTDAALAQLAPDAGVETPQTCSFETLQWPMQLYRS